MKRVPLVLSILLFLPSSGAAFCFEPSKPFCLISFGAFESFEEYESCRLELEKYGKELGDYARCLVNEVEEKREEALDAFNDRVNRTNLRR